MAAQLYTFQTTTHVPAKAVIELHRRAYAAAQAAQANLIELHELFDKEWEMEGADAIREALTTLHGPYAAEEIATYFAAEAAATSTAEAEDEAWRRVATLEPATRADLQAWLAYVNEHAGRQDTAVTLAQALAHVGGMLAERLPA